MNEERCSRSIGVVAERVGSVAAEVERAMLAPLDLARDVTECERWLSTGAGASEGPARLLATLLRGAGIVADFAPISAFLGEPPPADVCVVVSQKLSPNARLPLSHTKVYRHMVLVTTVDEDETLRGVRLVKHGPRDEDGLLLRVVGPAAANATVIRIAATVASQKLSTDVASALASARDRAERALNGTKPAALFDVAGLVAVGTDAALCDGLRHKLLEGLGHGDPPMWDLCSLVHGPLQSFYERAATLVLFERETTPPDLTSRLARVLHEDRHRLIRLRSALPGPLALVDFDLQLNWLVLAALRERPRDLFDWPGKGCDAPLYELGHELI